MTNIGNIAKESVNECQNCFATTKTSIGEFFDFLDCKGKGEIQSEDIYNGLLKMKLDYPLTAAMINAFSLKNLSKSTATINKT